MIGENSKRKDSNKNLFCVSLIFGFFLLSVITLSAQDFGFGFDDDSSSGNSSTPLSVSISGEVTASMTGYIDDFSNGAEEIRLGDIFTGKLNFTAETSSAIGVMNLELQPTEQPVKIDEAYVRAYFGIFEVEGGLRKLTWGKADRMGPLDIINPLDYSDLTEFKDFTNIKIARPLIRSSVVFGQVSKLEAVFVPTFEPAHFAESGRWVPAAMRNLPPVVNYPDTSTLNYAQAGLRFTTTIGGAADIGAQYYYGRRTTPAVTSTMMPSGPPPQLNFAYNPYHQVGVDYAQVLAGFNIRTEAAAIITEDTSGDDPSLYNPSFAWSFGFDRNLFADINLNMQCNQTIRLLDNNISASNDIEADSDITTTMITTTLSRKFIQDELELKTIILWEVESKACLIIPSIAWTKNDVMVELSAGVFTGNDEGLFGQFHDNSFVKTVLKYTRLQLRSAT